MTSYLLLVLVVLGVNLMPVLGPPTWMMLVLFRLHEHLAFLPLVLVGATTATLGRVLLCVATASLARWLPEKQVDNLRAAGELVQERRSHAAFGLVLFLLSPLPSAQLFEAAGLMRLALKPIAAAFLAGRLVSYSIYAGAATAADRSLGGELERSLTSWPSITLQAVLVVGVWMLSQVDWVGRLKHRNTATITA